MSQSERETERSGVAPLFAACRHRPCASFCDGPRRRLRHAMKLPLGRDQVPEMIRVVLTDAVYDAIASTLPKGAARWPMQRDRRQWLHPSRGGGGRPHEGHAQARRELQGCHLRLVELEAGRSGHEVAAKDDARSDREAQRMTREWKRLGAPGKSRSECALDERAAPKSGRVFCPPYGARWGSL